MRLPLFVWPTCPKSQKPPLYLVLPPPLSANPVVELNELLQANHLLAPNYSEFFKGSGYVAVAEATPELHQRIVVPRTFTSPTQHAKKADARKAAAGVMLNSLRAAIESEESRELQMPCIDVPSHARLPAIGVPTTLGVRVERAGPILYIKQYDGSVPHDSVADIKAQCPLSKDKASAKARGLRALEQQALGNRELRSASQLGAFHSPTAIDATAALAQMPFFEHERNVILGLEESSVDAFVHSLHESCAGYPWIDGSAIPFCAVDMEWPADRQSDAAAPLLVTVATRDSCLVTQKLTAPLLALLCDPKCPKFFKDYTGDAIALASRCSSFNRPSEHGWYDIADLVPFSARDISCDTLARRQLGKRFIKADVDHNVWAGTLGIDIPATHVEYAAADGALVFDVIAARFAIPRLDPRHHEAETRLATIVHRRAELG